MLIYITAPKGGYLQNFTWVASKIEKFKKDIPDEKFICKPRSIHGLQNRVWLWMV
jgi:hypothetical protein